MERAKKGFELEESMLFTIKKTQNPLEVIAANMDNLVLESLSSDEEEVKPRAK